ncbi:MAG: UPF0235 protein [bacterium]|nr:MAG: UPF0235 protein [bacterium]
MPEKEDWIQSHENRIVLRVKVAANSSKNQLSFSDDCVKIHLTAPPIDNRANKELINFLAKQLKLRKKDIEIIKGKQSKLKTIQILQSSKEYILNKINGVVNG